MWPFSSPRNPYRETIEAKRTCRADAIKLARPFSTEEHQKYLSATGTVQPALLLTLLLPYFRGLPSITDRREHRMPHVDCFGGARGLHRAGGASTPSDELLHGGHVRLANHYFLLTYRGGIDM
jgi:hypothetical protein